MKAVATGGAVKLRTKVGAWPIRTSHLLVRFSLSLAVKPIVMSIEAELKVTDTKDMMAAKSPASIRPETPVGSSAKHR
jgi:hypothetical protein